MASNGKTKATIMTSGTMHADLVWLLIDPNRMLTPENKDKPRDWVEVPTHVVIQHDNGDKLLWDSPVPRDWDDRWGKAGLAQFFPCVAAVVGAPRGISGGRQ